MDLGTSTIRKCLVVQNEKELKEARRSAEKLVREGEWSKAELLKLPGNSDSNSSEIDDDDDFLHMNSHVDEATFKLIGKGKLVDLAKLLPQGKILHDDGHLSVINKEGQSYFVPANKRRFPHN